MAAIAEAQKKLQFQKQQNRRGEFRTFAVGMFYSGGQKIRGLSQCEHTSIADADHQHSGNLKHSQHNFKILENLLANLHMQRMVLFAKYKYMCMQIEQSLMLCIRYVCHILPCFV